jgi:hypothetical protein
MLTTIHPKLPMRDKKTTLDYYVNQLGFKDIGTADYEAYLILAKDDIEIHFFSVQRIEPAGELRTGLYSYQRY